VLYAGTIDRVRTHAEYLLHKRLQDAPFDLAGPVGGWDDPSTFFSGLPPSMRYLGILDAKDLAVLRTRYAYTLVLWNPDSENTRYAAPNKFFESIAAGVPAIAAPHPQCATLIGRYGCGVLMQGWDLDAFADAVRKSLAMFGTPAYAAMVEGCRRAQQRELSWARQFDKLRPHLEPHAQEFRNGNGHR
jgi:glycosyltransferase involved in cell wall biosynthesis